MLIALNDYFHTRWRPPFPLSIFLTDRNLKSGQMQMPRRWCVFHILRKKDPFFEIKCRGLFATKNLIS